MIFGKVRIEGMWSFIFFSFTALFSCNVVNLYSIDVTCVKFAIEHQSTNY